MLAKCEIKIIIQTVLQLHVVSNEGTTCWDKRQNGRESTQLGHANKSSSSWPPGCCLDMYAPKSKLPSITPTFDGPLRTEDMSLVLRGEHPKSQHAKADPITAGVSRKAQSDELREPIIIPICHGEEVVIQLVGRTRCDRCSVQQLASTGKM